MTATADRERRRDRGHRVWAIVGPTASGKSGAAMVAAAHARNLPVTLRRDVEVVAVDAFTIYRGLDIASAKPTPADRVAVPHHLVDHLDATQEVSVADFQGWARAAIAEIHARSRTPLLVGGSGLYFRAVVDDLEFPPTDPDVRARLELRWGDDARGAHGHLAATDPAAADRIEPDNLRRTVRALEVAALTGRPFSSFHTRWGDHDSRYDLVVDYLEPPAEVLRDRIGRRTTAMVEDGLVAEVAALDRRGMSTTASQGIGVAEALAVLDGGLDPDDLVDAVSRRTWNYARRQRSWFRRDPRCAARTHDGGRALLAAHGIATTVDATSSPSEAAGTRDAGTLDAGTLDAGTLDTRTVAASAPGGGS